MVCKPIYLFKSLEKKSKEEDYFMICNNYMNIKCRVHKDLLKHGHTHTLRYVLSGYFHFAKAELSSSNNEYLGRKT